MANVDTFQDLILTLQQFWADKGCVLMQPYDLEEAARFTQPLFYERLVPNAGPVLTYNHAVGLLMDDMAKIPIATSTTTNFRWS